MRAKTQILCDVDYEKVGKQHGYLRVPYSDNDGAWANILIPLTVVKNGVGPTLLALGGVHGDEFEGPVALMKLARDLAPEHVHGRVIIIPGLNLPALRVGTRLSPVDGRNLNRAFPGSYPDSTTGLIAHYVTTVLFVLADVVVDIHSGGRTLEFIPVAHLRRVGDDAQYLRMLAAAKSWGAPYVWVYADIAGEEGILSLGPERAGKTVVTTEMGGGGNCSPRVLRITERGLKNLLIHQGITDGVIETEYGQAQLIASTERDDYLLCPTDGIYESFLELGDPVRAGEPVGQVHIPDRHGLPPEVVLAKTGGILICRRSPAVTRRGDCVAVIARPYHDG